MSDERPTLVQQRLTIDRDRVRAIWMTVFAVMIAVTGVARIVVGGGDDVLAWSTTGLALVVSGVGVARLLSARRRLRDFEAEHGAGAGARRAVGR